MKRSSSPRLGFALALAATILLAVNSPAARLPEKLRVLSCDLAGFTTEPASEATAELKKLLDKADPEIVFLQRVTDWETCDRICKLRPGLRVVTCSSFPAQPGADTTAQVAILARDKSVLSWVEEMSAGQGFAFAVIQAGSHKVGIFSVQTAANSAGVAAERLLAEVRKLQQFANNRPESFFIAGAPLAKAAMTEAGFESVAPEAPASVNNTEFWASNAGFLSRPRSVAVTGIAAPVLVADVDTGSSFSSKFASQTPLLFPGETPPPVVAVPVQAAAPLTLAQQFLPIGLTAAATLGALLLAAYILLRRWRSTSMALVPMNHSPTLLEDAPLDPTVRSNLLAWLKTIFVQRLISQRQEMIATEADATRRTLVIEEKLSQLQIALQDRISGYESRIARLETELSAATFENRELIRSQIDLLKEKVAKAKEEFVYRRN